jgi:hypothetical protein
MCKLLQGKEIWGSGGRRRRRETRLKFGSVERDGKKLLRTCEKDFAYSSQRETRERVR